MYDFLYDFCIFWGGQWRSVIFKNACFSRFWAFFSPPVNAL